MPDEQLAAETVERAALALECVDDIHGCDGHPATVLGVGGRVTDHVLEEHLEDPAGLLVNEAGDALDATTAGEAADGRLRDPLDVVAQHLAVALGGALAALAPPLPRPLPPFPRQDMMCSGGGGVGESEGCVRSRRPPLPSVPLSQASLLAVVFGVTVG